MRYRVRHVTRFDYASPVSFARCNLRLHPIDWDGQRVETHALRVEPAATVEPARPSGYPVIGARMVVDRPASTLVIESRATLVVERETPVALPDDASVVEAGTQARAAPDLSAMAPANYLYPSPLIPAYSGIAAWCAEELRPERGVVEAAFALTEAIRTGFRYDGSATTLDTTPEEAFAARAGVCQDFAQVMISGARAAGLAAAYVSGYLRTIPPPGQARLIGADATHAWVLIWCGDARGWIGFDPTNGVMVGSGHIITGIGRDYADVSPVNGIFLGRDRQSIGVSVDVEAIDQGA